MLETDIALAGGRTVHVHDSGAPADGAALTVYWHHGTPQTGRPPDPVVAATAPLGVRWIGHDRPGYGPSPAQPGRDVAATAADAAAVADALGVGGFAAVGASAGGPHALACAALLPDRVPAAVCVAGVAPYGAPGLDWYAGMVESNAAKLRAAARGPAVLHALLAEETEPDLDAFSPADLDALSGPYGAWLGATARAGLAGGFAGHVDDDVALVTPWGFAVADIDAPVLLLQGDDDRLVPPSHARWLARHCRHAELVLGPGDGHVSIFDRLPEVVGRLLQLSAFSSRRDRIDTNAAGSASSPPSASSAIP